MPASVSGNSFQFKSFLHTMGGGLSRAFISGPFSSATAEKAIDVPMRPLFPLALALCALLYQQGAELVKPNGNQKIWQKILTQTGLAALLVDNTKSIYPLWGLGLSAFQAGKAPNTLEKLHALVNVAVTFPLGYIGYHLMKGFSNNAAQDEDFRILRVLDSPTLKVWRKDLPKTYHPDAYRLQDGLTHLADLLNQQARLLADKSASPLRQEVRELRPKLNEAKARILDILDNIEKNASENRGWGYSREILPHPRKAADMRQAFDELHKGLKTSMNSFLRFSRLLNPLSGFILTGLVLGGAAARSINRKLNARYGHLAQDNRILDLFLPHASLMPHNNTLQRRYQLPPSQDLSGTAGVQGLYLPVTGRPGQPRTFQGHT